MKVTVLQRPQPRSILGVVADLAGVPVRSPLTNRVIEPASSAGPAQAFCRAPPDAPQWMTDPCALWPAVAHCQRRGQGSALARLISVGGPDGLSGPWQFEWAIGVADALVEHYGVVANGYLHAATGRSPAVLHVLTTLRKASAQGFGAHVWELETKAMAQREFRWIGTMAATQAAFFREAEGESALAANAQAAAEASAADAPFARRRARSARGRPTVAASRPARRRPRRNMGAALGHSHSHGRVHAQSHSHSQASGVVR